MEESTAVIRLTGLLNAHTAPSLKEQIGALINEGNSQLVLDLSLVDFIDSSGLAALVSGMKRTRTVDGKLHLVGAKDNVLDVFKLTMLDKVFNFFPTLEAAIQGF
jgi:anti-sigma B factor antagonist